MGNIFTAGLVSVAFRQYQYKSILTHMNLTNLKCIEWGSDIHVPIKNIERTLAVREQTEEHNIKISSYGSYYRLGVAEDNRFNDYLITAEALNTKTIRVWGGISPSASLTVSERNNIIKDIIAISDKSKKKGINISVEYHTNTITDNVVSAVNFIKDVRKSDNDIYLYWQPDRHLSFEENKKELIEICPYLSNIHVFAWDKDLRFPLYNHRNRWKEYFKIIADNSNSNHNALIEFVCDDTVEQFVRDAEVLNEILISL